MRLYRIGLRRLIERQPGWSVIGEATSPDDAIYLAGNSRPHVAIIDLRLEDGDGLDLVRKLHADYPEMRLVVSSVNDEELFAELCLQAGA